MGRSDRKKEQVEGGFMNIFNRVMAGVVAVILTATAFALPDLDRAKTPVVAVAYQGLTHVAHAVLVSAVRKVEVR
jgi:hypothetical protein